MNQPAPLTSYDSGEIRGKTQPRLWTPSLRELTPETSYGFDVIDFARDVLCEPLDAWESWAVIHGGELLPDGRPRFRVLLILVARQNGKTHLLRVLTLYWLFVETVALILGMSTSRDRAKESWRAVIEIAQANRYLSGEIAKNSPRLQIGEESFRTVHGSDYQFAATNRRAGRGQTIHRLIVDELREHDDWEAWNAATNALNAVPNGQIFCITNQGDEHAVVLDALREPAVEYIETGNGDPRLGLFEWSAPPGCEPDDLEAIAAANPNLGHRIDPDAILGAARRAKRAGGEELASFRTEVLCQRVYLLDPAIDPDQWARRATDTPLNLAEYRDLVALCLDVSLSGEHATLVAAAVIDGRAHVDAVKAWDSTDQLRRELPGIVERVKPRAIGYFPNGPAAAVAADLKARRGWPPRGTELVEIRGDTAAVCMGLSEAVNAGLVVHPDDELINAHVRNAQRLMRGDVWVYGRRGAGPVDGTYALAGAVHLARTLPPPKPALVVV